MMALGAVATLASSRHRPAAALASAAAAPPLESAELASPAPPPPGDSAALASVYRQHFTDKKPSAEALASAAPLAAATPVLTLASPLMDHMVLQHDAARLWGTAAPGARVEASVRGLSTLRAAAVADGDGAWRLTLPETETSGEPRRVVVAAGDEEVELRDVLFGHVFLCSGQSNMAFPLLYSTTAADDLQTADDYGSKIRLLTVDRNDRGGLSWALPWQRASPIGLSNGPMPLFNTLIDNNPSAICYRFGRELADAGYEAVGLVQSDHGGTCIANWLPADDASVLAEDVYQETQGSQFLTHVLFHRADSPRTGVAAPPRPRRGRSVGRSVETSRGDAAAATRIYQRRRASPPQVQPLAPLGLKGVIWYQGESDSGHAERYGHLLKGLIRSWRTLFERQDLFFGVVQLTAGHDPAFADAQLAALDEGHAAVAPTNDRGLGGYFLIHPPEKSEPARRMARATRAVAFGEDLAWRQPAYKGVRSVAIGDRTAEVVVDLENVAGPLERREPWTLNNIALPGDVPDTYRYTSETARIAAADIRIAKYDFTQLRCDLIPMGICAWANIYLRCDETLYALNATTTPVDGGAAIRLAADVPTECAGGSFAGTSHADGSVPLVSVYDSATGLPVQRWVDFKGNASNVVAYPARPQHGPAIKGHRAGDVDLEDFWAMWGAVGLKEVAPWPEGMRYPKGGEQEFTIVALRD